MPSPMMNDPSIPSILPSLRALYDDVPESLRITDGGIWHATPLEILDAAMSTCATHGLVRVGETVFDAGAGDGRVLAALALALPANGNTFVGWECDEAL